MNKISNREREDGRQRTEHLIFICNWMDFILLQKKTFLFFSIVNFIDFDLILCMNSMFSILK